MRITDSNVALSANTSSIETNTRVETLKTWVGNQRPDFENTETETDNSQTQTSLPDTILNLSEEGKKALKSFIANTAMAADKTQSASLKLSDKDEMKLTLIERMIEALTGKKFRLCRVENFNSGSGTAECGGRTIKISDMQAQSLSIPRAGWGLEYDLSQTHTESQTLSFSADGVVKTANGREINFSVELNMSRTFTSQTNISIRAGDAVKVDPLVINFGTNAPSLTQQKYSFDIDNDGDSEQISFVSKGSGFLALDSNNDGIINNGSELFGPQSGDGFSDLAKYDTDGNNWIDENDAVYDKLRIWSKDENGNDQLVALGQKGIGAIYLGNVSSAFSLKDSSNNLQGEIAKTGIYLNENGTAGTIQHIDLAV